MVRKRNVRKHHTLGLQKKTTQTGNEWLVPLHHIGIALGVGSDILKSIIRDHLPQQYKFSRKQIGIDISYDSSKFFTTVSEVCRVMLGSTHPDKYDFLDFLVERHNNIQEQAGKHRKKSTLHLAIVYICR